MNFDDLTIDLHSLILWFVRSVDWHGVGCIGLYNLKIQMNDYCNNE